MHKTSSDHAGKEEPPTGSPSPATDQTKHRRPLTPAERKRLEEKVEKARKSDPDIYPLW